MSSNDSFTIGKWLAEPELDRISSGTESTRLRPRVMDLLVYLAKLDGRVASTDNIISDLWPGKFITSGTVYNCVTELRQALEEDQDGQAYIENIPRRGYRLLAPVTGLDDGSEIDRGKRNPKLILASAVTVVLVTAIVLWPSIRNSIEHSSAVIDPASIAVLAFVNMSPDPGNAYFADGLSEELLNGLANVKGLRVTARTSSFSFKNQSMDVREIGRILGVANIVQGSVRVDENGLRVTAQLINTSDGTHRWSGKYDRRMSDLLDVQDEIAQAVVNELKVRLVGDMPRVLKTTPEAYTLYLQSRSLMFQRSAVNLVQAETLLKSALEIDSGYVPAWVQLGNIYLLGVGTNDSWTPYEGYPRARAAAMEALRLDADNARAHALLAWIARAYDYDIAASRLEQEIALALAPHDSNVLIQAFADAMVAGEYDAAIRISKEAEKLDPLWPFIKRLIGHSYYSARRFDEAIFAYRAAIALNPSGIGGIGTSSLGRAMLASGDHDGALKEFNKLVREGARFAGRALVFQAMGDTEHSSAELSALIAVDDELNVTIARVHAYRGELDQAFARLSLAIDLRDPGLTFGMSGPFFDNLREEPRFDVVLKRLGHKAL